LKLTQLELGYSFISQRTTLAMIGRERALQLTLHARFNEKWWGVNRQVAYHEVTKKKHDANRVLRGKRRQDITSRAEIWLHATPRLKKQDRRS